MEKKLKDKTDLELYEMLCKGKNVARGAFEEIYERYSDRIFTYCRRYIVNTTISEDLFQEVFLRLYTSSQKGEQIHNVGGFLITVARNLCHNELKRKMTNYADLNEINLQYTDKSIENNEVKSIVNMAIDSLPHQFREVIIMKEYMDMTYAEIAQALDQSISAVRIRIFRAKEKLREILIPYLNDLQD
ncbi:MAG: RNA polymerase sigma factor [Candidatus Kapabacteria bacterium]|jgi:RNA polymerase sigma-70 factor (ECF subfamily)|nr:RNA polymerase sigma factor [Candidatus Kapabacteria bacterium]